MVCRTYTLVLLACCVTVWLQGLAAESDFACSMSGDSGIQLSHVANESFHIYQKTIVKKNKVAIFVVCMNTTSDSNPDEVATYYRLGCSFNRMETEANAKIMSSQTNSSLCLNGSSPANDLVEMESYGAAEPDTTEVPDMSTTLQTDAVRSIAGATSTPGTDVDGGAGESNATTTVASMDTTLIPEWAVLQVLSVNGVVMEGVTTVESIRLRAQGLTSTDYQPPFIEDCWYTLYGESGTNETGTKFVQRGCQFAGDVDLVSTDRLSLIFTVNGPLEVQSPLFDLMPLYEKDFTDLEFTCTVNVCTQEHTCKARCPSESNAYTVSGSGVIKVNVSTLVSVEKKQTTTTRAPTTEDSIARGPGKPVTSDTLTMQVEKTGLDKYSSYFTVASLGIGLLVLLVLVYLLFRITRRSPVTEPRPDYPSSDTGDYKNPVFHPDKPTATMGNAEYVENGLKSHGAQAVSPPPHYTSGSNIRAIAPSHAGQYAAPVNTNSRLLATRSPDRALIRQDFGAPVSTRSPTRTADLDRPTRFQDTRPVASAVGGEMYPQTFVGHSKGHPGEAGIVSRALEEYFDKHAMNRPVPAARRPSVASPRVVYAGEVQPQVRHANEPLVRNLIPAQSGYVLPAHTNAQLLRPRLAASRPDVISPRANLISELQSSQLERPGARIQELPPDTAAGARDGSDQPPGQSRVMQGEAGILSRALEEYLARHLYGSPRQ